MKKLISAVAIAAVGIVSLAASPARADERGHQDDRREHAPYAAPARADERGHRDDRREHAPYEAPARPDERGHRDDRREHAPYAAPARPMPVGRAAPVRYYERNRWEAERARERQQLDERREEFYAHRHNRRERARFDAWYADRCHDLDRGLRINIGFPF